MQINIFNNSRHLLAEGLLWHPKRQQLFWFDILQSKLFLDGQGEKKQWSFDKQISAAGWVDYDRLLIASEKNLGIFNISTGITETLTPLEENNKYTRSNDGRADPWGGFWIGTMAKELSTGAKGAFYRFYQGEIKTIAEGIGITNSLCFSIDKRYAYCSDSEIQIVWRYELDKEHGWPLDKKPEVFLDLSNTENIPDGAIVDSQGCLWIAMWGTGMVKCFNTKGEEILSVLFPTSQITCPAFGGDNLQTLFVGSAAIGSKDEGAGKLYSKKQTQIGMAEYQVKV